MSDALSITSLKRLGRRASIFFLLSMVGVYVTLAANGGIRDIELYLGFVIAFTTVLMGMSLTMQLIAWLLSWRSGSPD